jgi:hypothetical protein
LSFKRIYIRTTISKISIIKKERKKEKEKEKEEVCARVKKEYVTNYNNKTQ